MVVQVDESGANHQAAAVDGLPRRFDFDISTHGDDHSIAHRNTSFVWFAAAAVDDRAALKQNVDFRRLLRAKLTAALRGGQAENQ
jgi:hypothetical protein